jgi:hypothetical protein
MSLLSTDVLQVAPAGSRWSVLGKGRKAIACFGTEEEAVAYAGFLARSRPIERVQILDFDGSIALEEWLSQPEKDTRQR